ncbi:hypothetical protein G6F57_005468 [Rhizopus arrhizus]|uniref:Uncharacterized protein n=1 Tax=Rhizopus oryzae TaxID=64495 RepID=A0A9P6XAC7_RHIOR|nr:hypothetical protein G6F23_008459 [Rhizopus arrhizus]KAG1426343.1 hypothetical protein G6F58_001526 [Rhizopus delemar]KAG0764355.1 hypothetical protein G6F24_005286 [Rhizopus arrhizus]KAG0790592.1 hypothetical protein G6F21_005699 [Rhizopus arrhizus]KAG0795933.1 hypothetical protein G6F22_005010 [Rhizopus arrhizus]
MSPTTIVQSVLTSQPNDSNGSKTEEIDLTTSASKYATIDPVVSMLEGPYLVVCGVLCLWRTHWKHLFDGTTFWPNEAAARATIVLRRIHLENLYQKKFKDNNRTTH